MDFLTNAEFEHLRMRRLLGGGVYQREAFVSLFPKCGVYCRAAFKRGNMVCDFEDIHQKIFQNLMKVRLYWWRLYIFKFCLIPSPKMYQFPPLKSDFHQTVEGRSVSKYQQNHMDFYICSRSKDMADFGNLQG